MVRVKDIPMPTRWAIATQALSHLVMVADPQQCRENPEFLLDELGEEIREIADRYDMPREDARDLVQTLGAISVILFGPTFETPYIEGFHQESVIRLTECAMFRPEREKRRDPSQVHRVCSAYVKSAIKALNPDYTVSISRARCRGDTFCEMIIEKINP
ncbi:MAG: hypothetical protein MUC66_00250 [Methanolinea sp.]|jgi:hypothetical protein|nr:hypothetical protein [Methanolinea sp.]